MQTAAFIQPARAWNLPLIIICIWFAILFCAGGASRPDVPGQLVVRIGAWGTILALIMIGMPRLYRIAPTTFGLLCCAIALPLLQLLPLPPTVWTALPGREMLKAAAETIGAGQPWRPLSISPGSTVNAASSMVIPFATLCLVSLLRPEDDDRLLITLLIFVSGSAAVALLQASGAPISSPFTNYLEGAASGPFANRNHMAAMCAIGCLAAPVYISRRFHASLWTFAAIVTAMIYLIMTALATGSRAGMGLVALGSLLGVTGARSHISASIRRLSPMKSFAVISGTAFLVLAIAGLAIWRGKLLSIDRAFDSTLVDSRPELLSTVVALVKFYFPAGSGFGTFDRVFRIHEPTEMLQLQYYNLAHNDILQVALDGGLLGSSLLGFGLWVWLKFSIKALRAQNGPEKSIALFSASAILLIVLASLVDYPVRTPIYMAWIVVFAYWLEGRSSSVDRSNAGGFRAEPYDN